LEYAKVAVFQNLVNDAHKCCLCRQLNRCHTGQWAAVNHKLINLVLQVTLVKKHGGDQHSKHHKLAINYPI